MKQSPPVEMPAGENGPKEEPVLQGAKKQRKTFAQACFERAAAAKKQAREAFGQKKMRRSNRSLN